MRLLLCLGAFLVSLVLAAEPAEAAKIPYKAGDYAITKVDELPDTEVFKNDGKFFDLGWLHREYSIFGGAFWVFDEQGYVLYSEDGPGTSYFAVDEDGLKTISEATGKTYPAVHEMTLWQRWAGLIVFSFLMVIGTFRKLRQRGRAKPPRRRSARTTRQSAHPRASETEPVAR